MVRSAMERPSEIPSVVISWVRELAESLPHTCSIDEAGPWVHCAPCTMLLAARNMDRVQKVADSLAPPVANWDGTCACGHLVKRHSHIIGCYECECEKLLHEL